MTVYTVTTLGVGSAYGINNAGQIVGTFAHTTASPISLTYFGFLYNTNDGSSVTLSDPFALVGGIGGGTFAQGANDGGQVVGYYDGLDNFTNPTSGTFARSSGIMSSEA